MPGAPPLFSPPVFPVREADGEGDREGGGGALPSQNSPSTRLRPTAAAQPVPALGMPPACRPAYALLPMPCGHGED
jgi:hypothetical protein